MKSFWSMATRYGAWCLCFALIAFLVQLYVGAYGSDHGQNGDEASYFVSSLMIADYLHDAVFTSPLAFAKMYYAHFPRVAIGHYPPMFMLVQGLILAVVRNHIAIVGFLAVAGGCCAGVPAAWIARTLGWLAGLCAGFSILLNALIIFPLNTDMTEPFLTLLVTLSALAWADFHEKNSWGAALRFAIVAAAACLTKGTALCLVLLPVIQLALQRDLKFLLTVKPVISAAMIGAIVVPWYLFTYKLAASGFNYSWGINYVLAALRYYSTALLERASVFYIALFLAGTWSAMRMPPSRFAGQIHAFIGASLAMILAPILIPADLTVRYLAPAIPGLVIVAIWTLFQFANRLSNQWAKPAILFVTIASIASSFERPHIEPFHSDQIAHAILQTPTPNYFVLVSGESTEEGAVISSFAEQDRRRRFYVLRSSQLLAGSDFMGREFKPKFKSPQAMAAWIRNSEIGWLILDHPLKTDQGQITREIEQAILAKSISATKVMTIPNERLPGTSLTLYRLPSAAQLPRAPKSLLDQLVPGKTL